MISTQDWFNNGFDDGYQAGFLKGCEEAKIGYNAHIFLLEEHLKKAKEEIKGLHTAIVSLAKHIGEIND